MRRTICLVPLALLLSTYLASTPDAVAARGEMGRSTQDAKALFLQHCASCHGEKGDGQGTTDLDRAARSFMDGGFSFGNTKAALFRTITHGIPGSPMPSFEGALKEEERRALADYVVTLGPPIQEVSGAEMELVVEDKAVIVRGKLPPLWDGDIVRPRGLVIGTPDGFSFVYDAENVQLLQVRTGRFVKRTDWSGRGGSALELLSIPVWSRTSADTASDLETLLGQAPSEPRVVRLTSTSIRAGTASIGYRIETEGGWIPVREVISPFSLYGRTGFTRQLGFDHRPPRSMPEEYRSPPLLAPVWTPRALTKGRRLMQGVHAPSARNRATIVRIDAIPYLEGEEPLREMTSERKMESAGDQR